MAAATKPRTPALESRLFESISSYDDNIEAYVDRYKDIDFSSFRDRLIRSLDRPPERLLDVGCGTGRDARAFTTVIPTVIGIDLSAGLLSAARSVAADAHFLRADMRQLPLRDDTIDAVWSMASIVHLESNEAAAALREIRRVLRNNGGLLLSVPKGNGCEWRSDGLGGRRWFNYFPQTDLKDLVTSNGFHLKWISSDTGVVRGDWTTLLAFARP